MLGRLGAGFFVLAMCGLVSPAFAIQCDQATARPDKLICADPALNTADASMAVAYASLRAALPKDEQSGLLADQRQWLSERAACIVDDNGIPVADTAAIDCMRRSTEARRTFLSGGAPGAMPRIAPHFLYSPSAHNQYGVEIAYPEIAVADTPALKAANALLRHVAIGDWTAPHHGESDHLVHQVRYRVTLATPHFASIAFSTYDENNAAYPTTGGTAVNVDLGNGEALSLAALLRPGAIDTAASVCTAQLTEYYSKAFGEPWQPAASAVQDVANDVANWEFFADHAILAFREESVGPHALGAHDCVIDAKTFATMIKPGSPIAVF